MEHGLNTALRTLELEMKLAVNERLFAGGFISQDVYQRAKAQLMREQPGPCGTIETRAS